MAYAVVVYIPLRSVGPGGGRVEYLPRTHSQANSSQPRRVARSQHRTTRYATTAPPMPPISPASSRSGSSPHASQRATSCARGALSSDSWAALSPPSGVIATPHGKPQ